MGASAITFEELGPVPRNHVIVQFFALNTPVTVSGKTVIVRMRRQTDVPLVIIHGNPATKEVAENMARKACKLLGIACLSVPTVEVRKPQLRPSTENPGFRKVTHLHG